ncbi:PepSY-associated TM helix domain-containing protein [Phenylobacterium sp. VNQ135]|uniref:PepSY-associated TM helix domain-containing protein n=1 Tax=Phenylobacterium sp. VNQ135 TaxID=3400922 RepID=UPI003C0916C9
MGFLRTLHAWAGAILALLLVVLGLSGSLLVLRDPWVKLTTPEARASAVASPQALGAAVQALEMQAPGEVRNVVFGRPDLGVHRVYFKDKDQGYAAVDGRLIRRFEPTRTADGWLFELHHYLLAGETGMKVGGAAGLAGAVLVLTGVIVWAPTWRTFGARVWPRTMTRRADLVGSHRNLGMITAVPVLVLCLTGGAIVFSETTQKLMIAAVPGPKAPKPPKAEEGEVNWMRALSAAQAAFPDATLRMAAAPTKPGAPASIRMKQPGEWHPNGRTVVWIDPSDERVLGVVDAMKLGGGVRAYNAFYPLHAAKVGGLAYEAVVFLGGLALAGLGGFGLWSFLLKQTRRRPARTRIAAQPAE